MNIPAPEKRRVKVCAGTLPSPKITALAACHPFTQQLDVVFPANADLLARLGTLEASYSTGRVTLLEVVAAAQGFVSAVEGESDLLIVSSSRSDPDSWCVDPRGYLTLSAGKEVYERLGLVGQKLPFKGHEDRHTIDIPLRKNGLSPKMQARVQSGLGRWDLQRAAPWDVVLCCKEINKPYTPPFQTQAQIIRAEKRELEDVLVPVANLCPRPSKPQGNKYAKAEDEADADAYIEAVEDWDRRTEGLFEWVGMACLGAQRLNANDRVDPYVALYEVPEPTHMGNVTHLRWRGLLPPSFVNEVLDIVISTLRTPTAPSFASVTAHALTSSPVSYMPYTALPATKNIPAALQAPTKLPAKVPRIDGDDTWCAIFEPGRDADSVKWCLGESLGQLDARWG